MGGYATRNHPVKPMLPLVSFQKLIGGSADPAPSNKTEVFWRRDTTKIVTSGFILVSVAWSHLVRPRLDVDRGWIASMESSMCFTDYMRQRFGSAPSQR